MQSLADFYTKRNANIIRQFQKLRAKGVKTREAGKLVAEQNEGISEGLVNVIVYAKKYPYAAEAREIVRKEQEEAERKKKDKEAAAPAVGSSESDS